MIRSPRDVYADVTKLGELSGRKNAEDAEELAEQISTDAHAAYAEIDRLRDELADLYPIVLVSAVRYALGRSTYVVQATVAAIERHASRIREGTRQIMIRDIETELGYADGMHCDQTAWQRALTALRQEP